MRLRQHHTAIEQDATCLLGAKIVALSATQPMWPWGILTKLLRHLNLATVGGAIDRACAYPRQFQNFGRVEAIPIGPRSSQGIGLSKVFVGTGGNPKLSKDLLW